MKFAHSLQFNAVPEWSSKYINYSSLKKILYTLQRENAEILQNTANDEESPFESIDIGDPSNPIDVFTKALDKELSQIDDFYTGKEREVFAKYNILIEEITDFEIQFPDDDNADDETRQILRNIIMNIKPEAYRDTPPTTGSTSQPTTALAEQDVIDSNGFQIDSSGNSPSLPQNNSSTPNLDPIYSKDAFCNSQFEVNTAQEEVESLRLSRKRSLPTLFDEDDFNLSFLDALKVEERKPLTNMFVLLSELKSFIELNRIGFGKAAKKFDKTLLTHTRDDYMDSLPQKSYIFQQVTIDGINEKLDSIISIYSIFTAGKYDLAKQDLRSNLREYIVWERNTVWRNMIGMERKTQAAYAKKNLKIGENESLSSAEKFDIPLGAGRKVSIPSWIVSGRTFKVLLIAVITLTLMVVSPFEDEQQKNCFAVLVCASLLWATEAIPLFVTSLVLPFLLVVSKVLKDTETGEVYSAPEASKFICGAMWSPIILLLLGGFTLAAALSKYNLDKIACTFMLSKVPQQPIYVLLSIMVVSTVVAAFVSNVAAPVLMFSVIQPILNTLPEGSAFAQALVVGIALASNVAGMASPIASPQNVIALQDMDPAPNWLQWFAVSIPVCGCGLLLIFIYLLFLFDFRGVTLVPIKSPNEKFTFKHYYVITVSIITIFLWCITSFIQDIVGDMGMIAIASMTAFYAPGILSPDDFNNYPWTIVMLAMGGLSLGKAVTVSGLLKTIAELIQQQLVGAELFTVLSLFGIIVLITATFVSHTVAALIIVPLIAEIGRSLPDPHPNLLVMATAFLCSSAMGLPTSGFPNVTAIGLRDNVGSPYLTVGTFMKTGIPSSIFCYFVVIFVGYLMMKLLSF